MIPHASSWRQASAKSLTILVTPPRVCGLDYNAPYFADFDGRRHRGPRHAVPLRQVLIISSCASHFRALRSSSEVSSRAGRGHGWGGEGR